MSIMKSNKNPHLKVQIEIVKSLLDGSEKTQNKIGKETGYEKSTISKALDDLEKKNVIRREKTTIESGNRNKGQYKNKLCHLTYEDDNGFNVLNFFREVLNFKKLREEEAEDINRTLRKSDIILAKLVEKTKTSVGYKRDADFEEILLFCWDEVPGNDNRKLLDYLKEDFGIDWGQNVKIEKTDNGDTIRVSSEKTNEKQPTIRIVEYDDDDDNDGRDIQVPNPNNFLTISLREVKNRDDLLLGSHSKTLSAAASNAKVHALLQTEDSRLESLVVKKENGKINIYKSTFLDALIDREKLQYYLSDKDLEWILRVSPRALKTALDLLIKDSSSSFPEFFNELMLSSFALDVRTHGDGVLVNGHINLQFRIHVGANIDGMYKLTKSAGTDRFTIV